ncbi:signal transduction histidine kinase [Kitasatospora sp. GP30]|uniref:sensor histidine kinase n=1 Tax=Kitasatospora sp. GP30 TaxID=3035084 RepID=UPI000C6FE289|nr:sensor histidine kinase [Kitasatospora sp. GP30]MDH6142159.1 signal transduction histidine kinase [Kitasatospora sp. GP30]
MDGSRGNTPWHRSTAVEVLVAVGYALVFLTPGAVEPALRAWLVAGTLLTVVAPLPLRWRWPRTVFCVVLVGNLVACCLGVVRDPLLAAAFALYPAALGAAPRERRGLLRAGGGPAAALLVLAAATGGVGVAASAVRTAVLGALALAGSWTLARAAAGRRAQAERAVAEAARRAVTEERLRLARELHDVVSGTLAVILVHASVGRHLADREPARPVDALGLIETASKEAIAEMREMLDILRTDGPPGDADEPLRARLLRVVDTARAVGVETSAEFAGLDVLPPRVNQAVYRIVQEGLTNVIRHAAPTRCRVRVSVRAQRAEVEITDAGPAGAAPLPPGLSFGRGLTGMRERVTALDGTLTAEPVRGGGFRLLAAIPLGAGLADKALDEGAPISRMGEEAGR